jgi:4-amino-4-deoxy-L-arabinose transferase-like glycosyltransferase
MCDFKRDGSRWLAFFFLALLIRLVPWGLYVTPDEPIWVFRSVRFVDAIAARDYAAVPQTGHPGITTMLLGALGVRLTSWIRPVASQAHLTWIRNMAWLAPENAEAFPHLVAFLGAGRGLVACVTSVGVAVSYALAQRRLGEMAGRLLALFLALDPFFAGHAGLLHTDALQATFVMLAVLLALPPGAASGEVKLPLRRSRIKPGPPGGPYAFRSKGRRNPSQGFLDLPARYVSLAGAALALALAGLTKSLGLLVAPGLAVAVLLFEPATWPRRFFRVGFLAALSLVFLLALYPPFWVAPRQAVAALGNAITYHEGLGLRDVFFAGRMTSDPGPWFYPLVLLFRLTPPVGLGIGSALVWRGRNLRNRLGRTIAWFALPLLPYLLALSVAHKKFDRYVLSGIGLLIAMAAVTWARFWERGRHRSEDWRWRRQVLLVSLLLPWALCALLPLTYANPLVGGPWLAQHIVPLGWGEAFGLSTTRLTRALRAQPSASEPAALTLLTSNVPGTAPFFPGETYGWDPVLLPCVDALVLTGGGRIPVEGFERVTQVRLAGRTLAGGYARTALRRPLTACTRLAVPQDDAPLARFSGALILRAAAWPSTAQAPQAIPARFRWYPRRSQAPLKLQLYLEDRQRLVWAEGGGPLVDDRTWPASAWEVDQGVEGEAHIGIPLSMPPGTYTLTLGVFDSAGRRLGYWGPEDKFGGTRLPLGPVVVSPAPYPAAQLSLAQTLDVSYRGLTLIGASALPPEHWAGDPLPFQLGWMRTMGDPLRSLRWALACENGGIHGGDVPLAPQDPSDWPIGYRYETRYAPRTDPLLPEGDCTLFTSASGSAWSDDRPVALGRIRLRARERTFALSEPPQIPLSITVGHGATLMGLNRTTTTVQPGAVFTITLIWRARRSFALDYTVFVHMRADRDGHVWAQSDHWPQKGNAPTSSWVPGQIVVDTHTLTLPPDTPPGSYELFAGLYDAESGGRLPLYDSRVRLSDDQVLLGEISVVKGASGGTGAETTR